MISVDSEIRLRAAATFPAIASRSITARVARPGIFHTSENASYVTNPVSARRRNVLELRDHLDDIGAGDDADQLIVVVEDWHGIDLLVQEQRRELLNRRALL